ncbi:MAG: sugar phosphate nucleotidyltransferase [Erysipelotrichaceae bacterium]
MKKPVLVILAAGMGSRYGGLKQIDTVGNNGESIIDFSIYDAHEAGFEKVVLIIRKEHEEAFRKCLTDKVSKHMEVEFAYQDINDIPCGITVPQGREKPWGTTHALLACKNLDAPFAICNADDYYGKDAFKVIYNFLLNEVSDDNYGMVGYLCNNTLTDHGTVTRGICEQKDGYLTNLKEIQKIKRDENHKPIYEENGEWLPLSENDVVSMNFWGFTPKIIKDCQKIFEDFIKVGIQENPMKCEHVLPTAVSTLIDQGKCQVKVMSSKDNWFGVTYIEDKPLVVEKLQEAKDKNMYPFDLWK